MPVAMPTGVAISQSSAKQTTWRIISMKLGNGYEQRAADGVNAAEVNWSAVWENITSSEKTTIVNALNSTGGWDYLTWTDPDDGVARKFVIDGAMSISVASGQLYTVSVPLRQVFDL